MINVPDVAETRAKTGLSQARFAALLGVSVRMLQDWEQGRRAPSGAARMNDKPFALIGVNVNERESKDLKERMAEEKMNWRSFAHQEAINAKWNPTTPGYYVLDPKGVIRHKWVGAPGATTIDSALDKLIQEAEANRKKSK